MSNRNLILLLAFFTLIGFPAAGFLIQYLAGDLSFTEMLTGKTSLAWQILAGFPIGCISAFIALWIIRGKFMLPVRQKYGNIIGDLNLKPWHIVYISFCAGIGEEILFRGALQPLWGIWLTAVVFVALHGYLNPFDWRITVYGIYLTVVIIGLGFMCEFWGIWSAASAHAAIDIVLLQFLSQTPLIPNSNED